MRESRAQWVQEERHVVSSSRTGPPAHRAVTITLIALNIYEAHIWAIGHVVPCRMRKRRRSVLTNSFETSWKICNLCNLQPRKVCSNKKMRKTQRKKLNPLETMQITAGTRHDTRKELNPAHIRRRFCCCRGCFGYVHLLWPEHVVEHNYVAQKTKNQLSQPAEPFVAKRLNNCA